MIDHAMLQKAYYGIEKWSVIEDGFDPERQESSESIFSLGNGHIGQRANFEERYTGKSLQGNYIAGIYYPDKTRVGWWKNGYPEYFAKVPNAPNWTGIYVKIGGEELDLHTCRVIRFRRELNMKMGYLERSFVAELTSGKQLQVVSKRFLSIADDELCVIKYAVKAVNFQDEIIMTPFIDGAVKNRDANYDERFWDILNTAADQSGGYIVAKTLKSGFEVCLSMKCEASLNGVMLTNRMTPEADSNFTSITLKTSLSAGDELILYKYVAVLDSMNYRHDLMISEAEEKSGSALVNKYDRLFHDHAAKWEEKWSHSDILIEGDPSAQQGIRFNIFHLNQTYTGRDERLNIGPKGFTGEKYGGSTYWDTEAFLIPFYLSTEPQAVARNLLIYRYKHLGKAIENAKKLGFQAGAALYPMVTMNGEECHNEWEITFEEIHRNGAIAYAIYNYIRYTGDTGYLAEYGLEVLIALSRFWRQRVNWSEAKGRYVILGVTGPNEYENNVNNNWYTNKMASWTLKYTLDSLDYVMHNHNLRYKEIVEKTGFDHKVETAAWEDIIQKLYFPMLEEEGVFLQQEGFMDKEQRMASSLDPTEKPINQHWSWDRILRSVFIKQADVLQGIFNFEDEYDLDTIRRNFEFYESRTVHESSLSPCIHSVLASRIDKPAKAYELYLRTSRLDLDDYNKEVHEGLHITSMGGTWMSVVMGFGGLRVRDGMLCLTPNLPDSWSALSFIVNFRGSTLKIIIREKITEVQLLSGKKLQVNINGKIIIVDH
jgi:maltose phosphorylase